ncbi:WD repeat-containing protein 88-like [Littorina saxatilis]|uniref:WD repeat-containing protein 88-like n=1 Tax=Littorina saxatilis TaxID=31220 RepID=A0AAN9C031_9CAEN
MNAVRELRKLQHREGPPGIDPLAMEMTRDMNRDLSLQQSAKANSQVAKWEHEDLAQVRIRVFRGHTDEVNKCQFFNDETRVLSTSTDCSIKVWDPRQGTELQSLDDAHSINAADAHCLEDGSKLVSCGWDKELHLWDLETGEPIWSATHMDMLTCCKLSNDGRLLCVGSDLFHELHIYDVNSGELVTGIKDYHEGSLTSCFFSPDDSRVITTSTDRTAKFYDLRSETCTIHLVGHENAISDCSISMDERKFATSSWDKTIQIWDIATGMYRSKGPTVLKGSHDGSVTACNFTDDGLQLVSGSADMSIVVWDVENSTQKIKLQGHAGWVNDVHFSKDQCWLLSCAKDSTVRMWNIEESDKIPIVMENKRAQGLKVTKCSNCGKPFSMSELENFRDVTVCVFCRLQSPEKIWLSFPDEPET